MELLGRDFVQDAVDQNSAFLTHLGYLFASLIIILHFPIGHLTQDTFSFLISTVALYLLRGSRLL